MSEETKDKTTEELEPKPDGEEEHSSHEESEEQPKSRKFRKQLHKLEEKLAALEEQLKGSNDKYLRLYAEFDNFRKRMSRERIELFAMAGREIVESLLPVLDDLERARETIMQASDAGGAAEGFDLIGNKLKSILDQRGLKAMESVGEVFDPELHEAVSELEVDDAAQKGKVVSEVVKGYRLNDRIIRHAKVVVGK